MTLPPEERARLADRLWDSVLGSHGPEVVMIPELERLLDEGGEALEHAATTDELRHQQ